MTKPLLPGSIIGMLGSGQLGRMSGQAARQLGYRFIVLSPEADSPAGHIADASVVAPLDRATAYEEIAQQCAALTYEFENVSVAPLEAALQHCPVYPHPNILHTTQHRVREKEALHALNIPTADYVVVDSFATLQEGIEAFGHGVLKTVTGGYDGKGQTVVKLGEELLQPYTDLSRDGRDTLILERFVAFRRELSVIVARNRSGHTLAFPCAENIHRHGILHLSIAPARIAPSQALEAERLACRIAEGLDLVGVMGIELFETDSGLVVNELAPRPHNSGHYTLDACVTSQFEQHIRAVANLPLGACDQHTPAVMLNLLGEHMEPLERHLGQILSDPLLKLHLYGKAEPRVGRKMGHLTALGKNVNEALERLQTVWEIIDQ